MAISPHCPISQADRSHAVALDEIQEVIDGLVEQVALIACDGTIIAVNEHWRRQVERQARFGLRISRDYILFLTGLIESGDRGAEPILRAFQDIGAGSRRGFRCVYKGTGAFAGYDFNVSIAELKVHDTRYLLVSVHDVTELVALKRQRRRAGSQVLRAQEHERRRMARELHDSTSQMLISMQLALSRMGRENAAPTLHQTIAECKATLREVQREIRAFSFLAHPPSLSTHDLAGALETLTYGFAARTGLEIDLELTSVGEVSASVEAAIYRLSQEAFSNIYRHSGAKRAIFRLVGREHYIHLMIRDDGIGFRVDQQDPKSMGVGVIGMRERVRELGGRLSFHKAVKGTALAVTFPRYKRMVFTPSIGAR